MVTKYLYRETRTGMIGLLQLGSLKLDPLARNRREASSYEPLPGADLSPLANFKARWSVSKPERSPLGQIIMTLGISLDLSYAEGITAVSPDFQIYEEQIHVTNDM